MPLYMTVPLGVVVIWTLVLWVLAAYYGYICPAPWFENDQKRRLPRGMRARVAWVNADRSFDKAPGGMGRFANDVRHDSPPGFPQVGDHAFPRSAFFDALKSDDPLDWKQR